MKATPVQAHQISQIGGARSSDGRFGLIRFIREKPMDTGQTDVWVAVPTNLLPYLATVAVKALPQPQGGTIPAVLNARGVALGGGPNGEIVLSVALEKGAALSYRLEPKQAEGLLAALQQALGGKNGTVTVKGKVIKSGKAKD